MRVRTVLNNPTRRARRPQPRALLADVARAVRDLPGEILLGVEARAELARARQAMYAAGWANTGGSHADDVAELAMAWSRAERDRMAEFPTPRYHMLDIWMALGGDSLVFNEWIEHPKRSPADAWSQLMAAIRDDVVMLTQDTNPPAHQLLDVVLARGTNGSRSEPTDGR